MNPALPFLAAAALAFASPALSAPAEPDPAHAAPTYAVGDLVPEGEVLVPMRGYAGFATLPGAAMVVVVEPRSRTVVLVAPRPSDGGRLIPPVPGDGRANPAAMPLVQIRSPDRGT